jgi:hypothetical protein
MNPLEDLTRMEARPADRGERRFERRNVERGEGKISSVLCRESHARLFNPSIFKARAAP